jgi:hypothetical protein
MLRVTDGKKRLQSTGATIRGLGHGHTAAEGKRAEVGLEASL